MPAMFSLLPKLRHFLLALLICFFMLPAAARSELLFHLAILREVKLPPTGAEVGGSRFTAMAVVKSVTDSKDTIQRIIPPAGWEIESLNILNRSQPNEQVKNEAVADPLPQTSGPQSAEAPPSFMPNDGLPPEEEKSASSIAPIPLLFMGDGDVISFTLVPSGKLVKKLQPGTTLDFKLVYKKAGTKTMPFRILAKREIGQENGNQPPTNPQAAP